MDFHYLYTNDMRISNLMDNKADGYLPETAARVITNTIPSAAVNKSVALNLSILI